VSDVSDENATRILARMSRGCYAETAPVEFQLKGDSWLATSSVSRRSLAACMTLDLRVNATWSNSIQLVHCEIITVCRASHHDANSDDGGGGGDDTASCSVSSSLLSDEHGANSVTLTRPASVHYCMTTTNQSQFHTAYNQMCSVFKLGPINSKRMKSMT